MQKRYNHAGKQIIADDFIKTRGGGSSASLTKVQTIIGNAKNSKQINELSDKLKYITSDGIISVQEKKTLLREHSTLYSAYINIGNQMKDAGYTVNDNNLYSDLVLKNSELKAVMDRIEATEGDYTVQPDDNIDARFMDCWQAVNNCEYFLSQNRNFASRYSLQVDSLTTEVSDPVSFYANVYEGNVLQTDADFTREEEFSWTREGEGFTERKGCRKLTLYPSDIDGTESKFFCQWKHKMNTVDGTTPLYSTFVVPFLVKIAGIVEYTWSVKSEGLNMEAEVWTRGHVPAKPAESPTYYLWQRTSKDNGATWKLARSNAKPAPEDSDLRSFDIAGAVRNFNRSSRGYVYADQSLTFSIVKRNLSGTPTWSIEPENSNLVLADNQDGTATVTIKRGYEFGFFKIKAKLSDSDVTRTLLIDSAQPAPKRYNFKSVKKLPTNDTSNPNYPFIVPDEGLIMIYDYCTWVHTKDTETVNEVMFYNGTGWQNIDFMPENLKGETALDSLPAIMDKPNVKVEGDFINIFCDSLIANYIATNKLDAREVHISNSINKEGIFIKGKIYAGGYAPSKEDRNIPVKTAPKGFWIDSDGQLYANEATFEDATVSGDFRNPNFRTVKALDRPNIPLDVDKPIEGANYVDVAMIYERCRVAIIGVATTNYERVPCNIRLCGRDYDHIIVFDYFNVNQGLVALWRGKNEGEIIATQYPAGTGDRIYTGGYAFSGDYQPASENCKEYSVGNKKFSTKGVYFVDEHFNSFPSIDVKFNGTINIGNYNLNAVSSDNYYIRYKKDTANFKNSCLIVTRDGETIFNIRMFSSASIHINLETGIDGIETKNIVPMDNNEGNIGNIDNKFKAIWTSNMYCFNSLSLENIPTSSNGLGKGQVWRDGNVLKIV